MKFFLKYFDKLINKPYVKFKLNMFLFKINLYFSARQLACIHLYEKVKKVIKIRVFETNYNFTLISFFVIFILNAIVQIL